MRLLEAVFEERLNRFLVRVERAGRRHLCHLPNPGRLQELLHVGTPVLLQPRPRHGRKTAHDLVAVRKGRVWVSVDTRLPNRAVGEWLAEGMLPEFRAYRKVRPEVPLGESRIDFLLRNGRDCYLEVKSCTLVEGDDALFPDAPTERGRRHVETLAEAAERGLRASVLFVVQRPDASLFRPREETDPAFAHALRDASMRGVEVYAYRSRFEGGTLVDPRRIQTDLGPW